MSRELLLALDLGTTGVRALLVGPDGLPRARAYRRLDVRYPAPGRVEQDPAQLFSHSLEVLRACLADTSGTAERIAALGVVTQRSTVIAWDGRTGTPLAPAIVWQDQRTQARVAALRARGIPITTLASATKIEWWLEHEPAVAQAAAAGTLRVGTPDAWLGDRLTGGAAHVTDPGQASCTGLFDLSAGAFSPALCELFGVPLEALPRVGATSEVVGETPPALLGARIPVAARAGDQQSATFGQGVLHEGASKLTLGTSAMLDLHTGARPADPPRGAFPLALWTLASGARAFCLEGQVITAGAALDWLVGLGAAPDVAAALGLAAAQPGPGEGVFVPALQGLGTPHADPEARALFAGLSRASGPGELARAVVDGVAWRCAELIEALAREPEPVRVDGGLAQSRPFVQRIADLSGRSLLRSSEAEATALGAAWLAGLAVGVFASPDACARACPEAERVVPHIAPDERERLRARWTRALELARGPNAIRAG